MSTPSVLLISYHFYPSPEVGAKRPSETACYLRESGFDVTVLRGLPWNAAREIPPRCAELEIITVVIPREWLSEIWVWLKGRLGLRGSDTSGAEFVADSAPDANGGGPSRRGWLRRQVAAFETLLQGDKLWLAKCMARLLLRRPWRRFDTVVASGPPMAGYVCGAFAAKLFGARYVLDLRDPWYLHGDAERRTAAPGHPLCALENRIGRYCVARADGIAVASPGIARHLGETFGLRDTRVDLIRNGYDEGMVLESAPPVGRLSMLYAGSLYWNRNPFPLLEALAKACGEGRVARDAVTFRLVGHCAEWNGTRLQPWLDRHGLAGVVEILPPVAPAELRALMESANVLVNFAQGQPRQIPQKSYEYIAAGRDVLTIAEAESDVSRLFAEVGRGAVVEPGDVPAMTDAIAALYDRFVVSRQCAASRADPGRFARSRELPKFVELLEDVARV